MRSMRKMLSLLPFLLGLLCLPLINATGAASHTFTNVGQYFDVALNETCFTYSISCTSNCAPVVEVDLDCNCPVTSTSHNGRAKRSGDGSSSSSISWTGSDLGEIEICVSGEVHLKKHGKFVIKSVIVIIIGEIIVPDCYPEPTDAPTSPPTDAPTDGPTEIPNPQANGVCELVVSATSLQVAQSGQFAVSLASEAEGPISVTVSSACLLLSDCLLEFDVNNWNTPQVVQFVRNPAFPGTSCTVELEASGAEVCNASIPVQVSPQTLTPAHTYGDPHVITFDGNYLRSFGTGDYYFVRQFDGNFVIQTRQTKCGPGSCNTAAVVKFGTFLFYITLSPQGVVDTLTIGNAVANGVTITSSDQYRIFLPRGGVVSIIARVKPVTKYNFLTITASLPDFYMNQVGGLAGEFNGNGADDLALLVSGAAAPDLSAFLASNLVPTAQDLLVSHLAVIPLIRGASASFPFVVGATCTPYSPPSDVTGSLTQGSASPVAGPAPQPLGSGVNCTFPSEAARQVALSTCTGFFEVPLVECCRAVGVSSTNYFTSCLCDYALIDAADFTSAHVAAFISTCEAAANAQSTSCVSASEPTAPQAELPCSSSPCLNGGTCTNVNSDEFSCNCDNTGFFGPRCAQRVTCPILRQDDNAYWPQAFANTLSWGTCLEGYVGQPYRQCVVTGTSGAFGEITNPCISRDTQCSGQTFANAVWPATNVDTLSTGVCVAGYGGSPSRACKKNASWSSLVVNHCKRLYCSAENAGGAFWKHTPSLTSIRSKCASGLGTLQRTCQSDGTWGEIEGSCGVAAALPCPTQQFSHALWEATEPGAVAEGTCLPGWQGAPRRICALNGRWQSLIQNHCVRK